MESPRIDLTVEGIKEKYPNPTTCRRNSASKRSDEYCVGGAFIMSVRDEDDFSRHYQFPGPENLAEYLAKVNDNLLEGPHELVSQDARDLAEAILDANDEEEFGEAWSLLEEALRYEMEGNDDDR